MLKFLILSVLASGHIAAAATHVICTNAGNFQGSYYLDITGYKQFAYGAPNTLNRTLGFKEFRSWTVPVAELKCQKANPFNHGPGAIMLCNSASMSKGNFEAVIGQDKRGLFMRLEGPGVPSEYEVFCEDKEL